MIDTLVGVKELERLEVKGVTFTGLTVTGLLQGT